MPDETTDFIIGDAAADALGQGRRGRGMFGRRKKPKKDDRPPLTHCENCQAPLTGEFCSNCGQHAIDYRRSLVRVLIDAADSFFNWDTKFLQSIGILITRPWRLTNDFNAGRRARYVHPLRLYLLASIAFFLVFRLIQFDNAIQFDAKDRVAIEKALSKLAAPESGLDEAERAKVEEARAKLAQAGENLTDKDKERMQSALEALITSSVKVQLKEKDRKRLNKALDRITAINPAPPGEQGVDTPPAVDSGAAPSASVSASPTPLASPSATPEEHSGIHFSDKPDDQKDPFSRWMETRIKDKIGEGGTKGKLFLETLRSNIPTMMLFCVPLFAFVLKVLYTFCRRYYVEHLVYALHIHTFVYVATVLITLFSLAMERVAPSLDALRIVIIVLLSCTAAVQVFLSIRRVYRQGWFVTGFKFLIGGFAYLVILITAVATTAFVTLLLPN